MQTKDTEFWRYVPKRCILSYSFEKTEEDNQIGPSGPELKHVPLKLKTSFNSKARLGNRNDSLKALR